MLERVVLHQTRFRTPGVQPDARGVLLGPRAVLLFATIDRAVAFLRAWGEENALSELAQGLELRWARTRLGTRELLVFLEAESSRRMDRVAALARLVGGVVLTGTDRHFVEYRDRGSPLGYDVVELSDAAVDAVLYTTAFEETYTFERALELRDLVLRLDVLFDPRARAHTPDRVFVEAPTGLGSPLTKYLFRSGVDAHAALVELPRESDFDEHTPKLSFFDVKAPPRRVLELFAALPGVHVYELVGSGFGVEWGYRHPLALASIGAPFGASALVLFAHRRPPVVIEPRPELAHVRALVDARSELERASREVIGPLTGAPPPTVSLTLHLAPTLEPPRGVTAAVVPVEQAAWLARALYALPARHLASLEIAVGEANIYLHDARGLEGIPFGRPYRMIAPNVYVPVGFKLVPALSRAVLASLFETPSPAAVFFGVGAGPPRLVALDGFQGVERSTIAPVLGVEEALRAADPGSPKLGFLEYGPARALPLLGVPEKAPPADG